MGYFSNGVCIFVHLHALCIHFSFHPIIWLLLLLFKISCLFSVFCSLFFFFFFLLKPKFQDSQFVFSLQLLWFCCTELQMSSPGLWEVWMKFFIAVTRECAAVLVIVPVNMNTWHIPVCSDKQCHLAEIYHLQEGRQSWWKLT